MPGRIVDHLQWVGVIAVIVVVCSLVAPRTSIRASVLGSLVTPDEETGARNVPPRIIPVPDTVSPELRSAIAAPLAPKAEFWRRVPRTTDEWRAIIAETDKQGAAGAAELLKHYPVKVEQSEIRESRPTSSPRSSVRRRIENGSWSTCMEARMSSTAGRPVSAKGYSWRITPR